jgi:hypothetical protein
MESNLGSPAGASVARTAREMLDSGEASSGRAARTTARGLFVRDSLLPCAFLVAVFCALFGSMWQGGLWWKDSWYALLTTTDKPLHPQLAAALDDQFASFWNYAIERDVGLGRFRPLFWALLTVESALMRDHPRLWIAETQLIGIAAGFLLYFTARRLGLRLIPALLVALWVLIAGRRLWAELQLAEEPALLLTSLTLYAFVRAADERSRMWDALGLTSAICAGLFKESFAAILPALLIFRIWLDLRQQPTASIAGAVRARRVLLAIGSLAFVALAAVSAWLLLQPGGYDNKIVAAESAGSRWSPLHWIQMVWEWSHSFAAFTPLLGLAFLLPRIRSDARARRSILLGLLVVAAWLVPQFLIYGAQGLREHYFFPAILAIAFPCALGVDLVLRQRVRWLTAICVLLVANSLLTSGAKAANTVAAIAAVSEVQARWIESTVASTNASSRILLVTDPFNNSIDMTFLTMLGELDCRAPVSIAVGDSKQDSSNPVALKSIERCFPGSSPPGQPPRDLASFDRIACTLPEAELRLVAKDWYEPERWTAREFVGVSAKRKLSLLPPRLRLESQEVRYALLTRKP